MLQSRSPFACSSASCTSSSLSPWQVVSTCLLLLLLMVMATYNGVIINTSRRNSQLHADSHAAMRTPPLDNDTATLSVPRRDWDLSEPPLFCTSILRNPRPWTKECPNAENPECSLSSKRKTMFSGGDQDYYLYTRHFRHVPAHYRGTYVDVAANDAFFASNSYFFDRCLRWHGVCAEAGAQYHAQLFAERSCTLVPACVAGDDGRVVTFRDRGALGGIVDASYIHGNNEDGREHEREMKCTAMKNVLARFGDVNEIDYLSLDVEGGELDVLKGFNLGDGSNGTVLVKVMTVEVPQTLKFEPLETFLNDRGYYRHVAEGYKDGFLELDAIFVHQSVRFGAPK